MALLIATALRQLVVSETSIARQAKQPCYSSFHDAGDDRKRTVAELTMAGCRASGCGVAWPESKKRSGAR